MDYMLSLITNKLPEGVDFSVLENNGEAFKNAGNVTKHRNADSYDILLCGASNLSDFQKWVEVALGELIKLNFAEKLTGYFCMGLFMSSDVRVHVADFSDSMIRSLAEIGLRLQICYYPS